MDDRLSGVTAGANPVEATYDEKEVVLSEYTAESRIKCETM